MTTPDEMADALIDACAPDPKMQRVLDSWRRMYDGVCAELEEAIARAEAAEAQVAALREALDVPMPEADSCHWPAVQTLAEEIGYGVVISTAAALWRGIQPGGEFYVGPCRATAEAAIADTAAAARAYEARIRADEQQRIVDNEDLTRALTDTAEAAAAREARVRADERGQR